MDNQFFPEFLQNPADLNGVQILSQLPDHYLNNPTASNYVALGVVYAIMGLGVPSGVDEATYFDKILTGVFTVLNDKAVGLGLPAFDPPTPLSNAPASKISSAIDSLLIKNSKTAGFNLQAALATLRMIFGHGHTASIKTSGRVDVAIDAYRENTGVPFPKSVVDGGTWNYDGILINAFKHVGIPPEFYEDGVSWVITDKLLSDSPWIQKADPSRGNLGSYFSRGCSLFASSFRDTLDLHNVQMDLQAHDMPGEEVSSQVSTDDARLCLTNYRSFVASHGSRYHRDPASLLSIFDMMAQGKTPTEIKTALGLNPNPFSQRLRALKEIGVAFINQNPKFSAILEPLIAG